MQFNAVIFDLDGTLLNTLDDIADAANAALASLRLPPHPTEAFKQFVGDGVHVMLKRALPEGKRTDETRRKAVDLFMKTYEQN